MKVCIGDLKSFWFRTVYAKIFVRICATKTFTKIRLDQQLFESKVDPHTILEDHFIDCLRKSLFSIFETDLFIVYRGGHKSLYRVAISLE